MRDEIERTLTNLHNNYVTKLVVLSDLISAENNLRFSSPQRRLSSFSHDAPANVRAPIIHTLEADDEEKLLIDSRNIYVKSRICSQYTSNRRRRFFPLKQFHLENIVRFE